MNWFEWLEKVGKAQRDGYRPTVIDYVPPNQCEPTDAQPGSKEKVKILMARIENGQPLWHDDDKTCVWQTPVDLYGWDSGFAHIVNADADHPNRAVVAPQAMSPNKMPVRRPDKDALDDPNPGED